MNVIAGRWDVRRKDGTAVFFHPGHPYNVDRILETLVAARDERPELSKVLTGERISAWQKLVRKIDLYLMPCIWLMNVMSWMDRAK